MILSRLFFLSLIVLCESLGHFVSGLRYPIDIFLSSLRCFHLLVQHVGCCYCFLYRFVFLHLSSCLPDVSHIFLASVLAVITSCTLLFHRQVSLSHVGLRPAVMPNASCTTRNIVMLVSPHHSCTLSVVFTFSNTFSLHFIYDFLLLISTTIFGFACSGFQPFLPFLLLLMRQFRYPPTIRFHHPMSHSALDPDVPKTFIFHSLYKPLAEHTHIIYMFL